jgi:hypothetical protein
MRCIGTFGLGGSTMPSTSVEKLTNHGEQRAFAARYYSAGEPSVCLFTFYFRIEFINVCG